MTEYVPAGSLFTAPAPYTADVPAVGRAPRELLVDLVKLQGIVGPGPGVDALEHEAGVASELVRAFVRRPNGWTNPAVPVPLAVRGVVVDVARRRLNIEPGVASTSVGGEADTAVEVGPSGLLADEEARLRPWRVGPSATSAPMRRAAVGLPLGFVRVLMPGQGPTP